MPAGLRVIGDSGSVQIDDNFFNLSLIAKGSSTTDRWPYPLFQCTSKILTASVPGPPLIGIRCASQPAALLRGSLSGGTYTFEIVTAGGTQGTAFDYWVFARAPNTIPDHGEGLVVWRDDGSVAFFSGNKHMRIRSAIVNPANTSQHTFNSGREYCIVMGKLPHNSSFSANTPYDPINNQTEMRQLITVRGARSISSPAPGFEFTEFTALDGFVWLPGDFGGQHLVVDDRAATHLVVDVTGY